MLYNIPKHNCKNCGECCGPVPITKTEQQVIQAYVDKHKPKINKNAGWLNCKFRVDNSCSIYPVRPILCQLCGSVKGMNCKYGNTHEIDGLKFISKDKPVGLINKVIK